MTAGPSGQSGGPVPQSPGEAAEPRPQPQGRRKSPAEQGAERGVRKGCEDPLGKWEELLLVFVCLLDPGR